MRITLRNAAIEVSDDDRLAIAGNGEQADRDQVVKFIQKAYSRALDAAKVSYREYRIKQLRAAAEEYNARADELANANTPETPA